MAMYSLWRVAVGKALEHGRRSRDLDRFEAAAADDNASTTW
jgi:hypothetical protein